MGLFDWIGPTAFGKRRGWDALPALPADTKASPAPVVGRSYPTYDPGIGALFYPSSMGLSSSVDTAGNSAVFACLQAIATAVAEPELTVYEVSDGERIALDDTELGRLLAAPNPHLSLDTLLAYLSTCLHVDGNAYWRKLRAGHPTRGNVVELWPIAAGRIEPITTSGSGDYISYYRYTAESNGRQESIPTENVVHFRYGLDDDDHRLGCAPLKRLVREISSDAQATRYADRLLANLAINGLSLSFDKESPPIDQATADELKTRIIAAYGGDNVGSAAVLSPGATLTALGFSPEQLDMKTLHRVPEERISAVLGVPAIVAGLGAGLDRSTYANVREAREMFTESKMVPLWAALAATMTMSLVPDFYPADQVVIDFDLSDVRALADDENAAAVRLQTLVAAGILTVDEARAELGLDALPEQSTFITRPAEARSRPRIITLPLETKAAEDLPDRYAELAESSLPTWEAELIAFLQQQLARVSRRLRAGADTAAELVPEGEAVLLGETLTPLQLRTLGQVSRLVMTELAIEFQLDDPATRAFLERCGVTIGGITDTTRDAVRAALLEGQEAGEGIEQLARRLRGLPAFGQARAETVSRTELGHAQNNAALTSYRESGVVVGIRVHDGDYDEACQAMNGRTFPLEQAPPTLQHPRCVRAFAPLVDVADLEASA